MKCLRCGEEMKHYEWHNGNVVYGREHKPHAYSAITQKPHTPQSIYECENCGYCELSTNVCEEPDV